MRATRPGIRNLPYLVRQSLGTDAGPASPLGVALLLAYCFFATVAQGQPPSSPELNAKRGALWNAAIAAGQADDFVTIESKLREVADVEVSLFGNVHPLHLSRLDQQAVIARKLDKISEEIGFREKTVEMAKQLGQKPHEIRDFLLKLQEAQQIKKLTSDQRKELARVDADVSRGMQLFQMGMKNFAIRRFSKALVPREAVVGKQNLTHVKLLNNLGFLYQATGELDRAHKLLQEATQLSELVLGASHPGFATSLSNLASLCDSRGEFEKAESLYLQAKKIQEQVLSKSHPDYVRTVSNMAALYQSVQDFERAIEIQERLLTQLKSADGKQTAQYARSANNLGTIYLEIGDYRRAESLLTEAQKIRSLVLPEAHPEHAHSVNNLAALYKEIGDFAKSERLYLEALDAKSRWIGKSHPDYALTLDNLAGVYRVTGNFVEAEKCYLEAQSTFRRTTGESSPELAISLSNLAILYEDQLRFDAATKLLHQARSIHEQAGGRESARYASSLNNLAGVHLSSGKAADAVLLYQESMAITKAILGAGHPDYANSLNNLAIAFQKTGDLEKAETLFFEASKLRGDILTKSHPEYAASLNNLASFYDSQGRYEEAERFYVEAIERSRIHLDQTSQSMSERRQLRIASLRRSFLDNFLNHCIMANVSPDSMVIESIRWKGATEIRQRSLRTALNEPSLRDDVQQMQSVVQKLSFLVQSGPRPNDSAVWKKQVHDLQQRQEKLQAAMMQKSRTFRQSHQQVSISDVKGAIPSDGALVNYVQYNAAGGRSLAAVLVFPESDSVVVGLGPIMELRKLVDTWRRSFGLSNSGKQAAKKLRKAIWQPLVEHLGDCDLVFYSADGSIGRFPINALPGSKPGTYLIEDHRFVQLPAPQLLPRLAQNRRDDSSIPSIMLMGDIDYESSKAQSEPSAIQPDTQSSRPDPKSFANVRGGRRWDALSETGREIDSISKLFQSAFPNAKGEVTSLRRSSATENAFRRHTSGNQLLHIATHGFFAEPKWRRESHHSSQSPRFLRASSLDDGFVGISPGQLSGLVLAGANAEATLSAGASENDDGILTADEIAFMDLSDVRLAVLSACETGLGEAADGEGLLGLQRSFQIAGARSTIASLWKVNDAATRKMMEQFYTRLLRDKLSVTDALRETQRWAIKNPDQVPLASTNSADRASLNFPGKAPQLSSKADNRGLSPEYWAPFVLSGAWQ